MRYNDNTICKERKKARKLYFSYGETELSYLRKKDKRLGAVIDRIGPLRDSDAF